MLRSIFRLKPQKQIKLGRWDVNHNNDFLKAAYANHDSCGGNLCSKPINAEIINEKKNFKKKISLNSISDDDLFLYSMIGSFHLDPKKNI